jgi:hypothetical protein
MKVTMQKLKQILIVMAALLSFSVGSLSMSAYAQDCSNPATTSAQIQCGVNDAANKGDKPAGSGAQLSATVKKIINVLSVIGGALAVIMIIVGGVRYVVSAGNDSNVTGAKNTIIYAIVGLIIIAVAQVVVHFVLNNVT